MAEGKKNGIHPIFQIAPTTTEKRLKKITDVASGFLYIIGVEGVTGVRERIGDSTLKLVERVRRHTDMPLLAGFGISNRKQAAAVISVGADGAIAGSVYARVYEKNLEKPEETLNEIAKLVEKIKQVCIEGYKQRR